MRESLASLLSGRGAHASLERALEGLDPALRSRRPAGGEHSVWELVEHIRLAQEDLLRYTVDPGWESPPWPEGYWPAENPDRVGDETWERSLAAIASDRLAFTGLIEDRAFDLTATLPHGGRHTALREVLLAAAHASYHTAQIVDVRRALGAWAPGASTV